MPQGQIESLNQTGTDLLSRAASRAAPQQMGSLSECRGPRLFFLTRCA
jgi:hypothetical protein